MGKSLVVLGIVGAVVLCGLVVWLFVSMDRWEDRCHDAGGSVEERFEGFITVFVGNPPMPQLLPQYSEHCMVNGTEVSV